LIYTNGHYQIINNGSVVKEFGTNKSFKMKFTVECPIMYPKQHQTVGTMLSDRYWRFKVNRAYKYNIVKPDNLITVEVDGKFLIYDKFTGELGYKRDFVPLSKLSILEMFEWFYNFDIDKYGPLKFGYLKRLMIERGLLDEIDIPLQDYNIDFEECIL